MRAHGGDLLRVLELLEADHLRVAAVREVAALVEHVGDAAGHAGARSCGRCGPSTTTRPPVMYSQPWSPTASTTASTPLLRTQKRSPAMPRM